MNATKPTRIRGRLLIEHNKKKWWIELRPEGIRARRFYGRKDKAKTVSMARVIEFCEGQQLFRF